MIISSSIMNKFNVIKIHFKIMEDVEAQNPFFTILIIWGDMSYVSLTIVLPGSLSFYAFVKY